MQSLINLVRSAGFKATQVSQSEFEDGIGAAPGLNFVKGNEFYTEDEALAELGYILKTSTGKLQARSEADAIAQAARAAEQAGVIAAEFHAMRFGGSGNFSVVSRYVK